MEIDQTQKTSEDKKRNSPKLLKGKSMGFSWENLAICYLTYLGLKGLKSLMFNYGTQTSVFVVMAFVI